MASIWGSPGSECRLAMPFAELQEVLPPPRALRQQVRAVHPQVHQLQPRGRRRLPAEASERAAVSASLSERLGRGPAGQAQGGRSQAVVPSLTRWT